MLVLFALPLSTFVLPPICTSLHLFPQQPSRRKHRFGTWHTIERRPALVEVRDGSSKQGPYWPCKVNIIGGNEEWRIGRTFADVQDIVKMNIAFHKGASSIIRALKELANGNFHSQSSPALRRTISRHSCSTSKGRSTFGCTTTTNGSRPDEGLSSNESRPEYHDASSNKLYQYVAPGTPWYTLLCIDAEHRC